MITHVSPDLEVLDIPTRVWYTDLGTKPDKISGYGFRYNIELQKGEHLSFHIIGMKDVWDASGIFNEPDLDICKDKTKFKLECDKFIKNKI